MQVACLCLFVCLPDCWSAHQRNHHREKTQRDETERGGKNKQNKVFCLDLLSTFMWHVSRPVTLRDSHLKNCFRGQHGLPGNVRVIIRSVYPVPPSEGTNT